MKTIYIIAAIFLLSAQESMSFVTLAGVIASQNRVTSNTEVALSSISVVNEESSIPSVQYQAIHPISAAITKAGMITFIASMCAALPLTLFPIAVLHKARIINTTKKEHISLRVGQFCSRWLIRIIPFADIKVINDGNYDNHPEPSIWVCNHTSMLDIFFLLATDKKLRGKKKRPIKIVYWKDLEKNPITNLLFKMCGFLPVEMEDNGNGNVNQYKTSSFKSLLKGIKKAFEDGFDIGILPEGQLNPSPEKGCQPVFSGAYTMAKMSKRPIRMMGLHGLHHLWHGDEKIGMKVTGRQVKIRAYPWASQFQNSEEFIEAFKAVVGYFGAKGEDNPELEKWIKDTDSKARVVQKRELEPESI